MAESDAHYNGTPDEMNYQYTNQTTTTEDQGMTAPLPESGNRGAAYQETGSRNVPVISIPSLPNESSSAQPGNSSVQPGNSSALPGSGSVQPGSGSCGCSGSGSGNHGSDSRPGHSHSCGCTAPMPAVGSFGTPSNGMASWMTEFPNMPSIPMRQFGQVRFLNASTNTFTVNISIDNTVYARNSRFGTISGYDWISDGFHTVTVRRASGMRSVLLQQSFPFAAGQKVTMVLTDSAVGGLEMIRIVDTGCTNLPSGSGCYRFANMSYSGSRVDLLYGNETVFRNIGYQGISSYKQAVAGTYSFTVVNSGAFQIIRELPIIVIGAVGTSAASRVPLLNFDVSIAPGGHYTSYLIGNTWSVNSLQIMTVTDN